MHPDIHTFTSRGRDRHVIALLVTPDAMAMEIAVAQQVFGRRIKSIADVTPDFETQYELVLCGEQSRIPLLTGADMGELAPLDVMLTADTVIVPGVEDVLMPRSEALLASLRAAHDAGVRMVSFCGGAFLFAQAGILDGRSATTHWLLSKEFTEAYPQVRLEIDQLYVADGSVLTSGGVFAVVDLALHLIALDLGQAYANDIGRVLVSAPYRQGGQSQFIKSSIRADDEPLSGSFLLWLRDHIDEPLTLAQLANHEHVSERTLVRRFRQDNGMSVFDWIAHERVNQAKALLETTSIRVSEIAAMVGFGSAESLRRNFERIAGTSAVAYRSMFRMTPVLASA